MFFSKFRPLWKWKRRWRQWSFIILASKLPDAIVAEKESGTIIWGFFYTKPQWGTCSNDDEQAIVHSQQDCLHFVNEFLFDMPMRWECHLMMFLIHIYHIDAQGVFESAKNQISTDLLNITINFGWFANWNEILKQDIPHQSLGEAHNIKPICMMGFRFSQSLTKGKHEYASKPQHRSSIMLIITTQKYFYCTQFSMRFNISIKPRHISKKPCTVSYDSFFSHGRSSYVVYYFYYSQSWIFWVKSFASAFLMWATILMRVVYQ